MNRGGGVVVAILLVTGARSAAAWNAWPGPPAAASPEAASPATPSAAPSSQASDVEPPRRHELAAPRLAPVPLPSVPALVHPPAGTAPPQPPARAETGIGLGQIVLGSLAMVAAGGIALSVGDYDEHARAALLLASPLLGGATVCAIGRTSDAYAGGCGSTMVGAYAVALLPLAWQALGGCRPDPYGEDENHGNCIGPMLLAGAVYVVGTTIGATVGWHLGKKRRLVAPLALSF